MGNYYETFDPPFFPQISERYKPLLPNHKAYDRDDVDIVADLQTRLSELNGINTKYVTISATDQVVFLKGDIANPRIAQFIGAIAENIQGVRNVQNDLVVQRFGASIIDRMDEESGVNLEHPPEHHPFL